MAALDGLGLAYVFEEDVTDYLARGELVRVLEQEGCFLRYPSRRHQPPALQALVDALHISRRATASGRGPADLGAGRSSDTPPRHRS